MASPVKLSNKNLPTFQQKAKDASEGALTVSAPTYDRNGLKEGIVHIGVGGFHRAHLAVYVDTILKKFDVRDWAICGVGLQPFDEQMRDALVPQDGLYTVIERSDKAATARVVGSITSYIYAPDAPVSVIDKMANPDTHIVSMTITESGYYYNENTHELEVHHPDIVADLGSDLTKPLTTFGYLYAALEKRHAAGLKPFTVLSCDNMQKNGTITRNMLITFAKHRKPEIAAWLERDGRFPNSMVDRITPRTADVDKKALADTFGIEDAWPVVTEPFMQWVVEDIFADGRPPFEKVGVQVVNNVHDVEKFECHKLRLLNAGHTSVAYTAYLGGIKYVHEVFEHPLFHKYAYRMMHDEVKPLLPEIPGVNVDEYIDTLLRRFANPTIMDQITRLALNGSGKLPQFIMPSIAEQIMAKTHNFRRLVFATASWFRYLNGVDEQGKDIFIDDPMAEDLKARAIAGGRSPFPLMNIRSLFGDDLRDDKILIDELSKAMDLIYEKGALAALEEYA